MRQLVVVAILGAVVATAARCGDDHGVTGAASSTSNAGTTPAAVSTLGTSGAAPVSAGTDTPTLKPTTNGWLAVDGYRGGDVIYLLRPGERPQPVKVSGPTGASAACPAWSPDGTRLAFGRVASSSQTGPSDAELVIVPVGSDGAIGTPKVIGLDGFEVLEGFDAHPCGTWSPDGRWIAFAGTGAVWVLDTQTEAIRQLPDLRPSDLEWRPGTDELAIAGDVGMTRSAPTVSAPVHIYSAGTGELTRLGNVVAAHITWSPGGTTLAYTGGEFERSQLWLVDADGANGRLLVRDLGQANHGIGPVWSPAGDRIVYQRLIQGRGEAHEVVLVNVRDGSERVIGPPVTRGFEAGRWYPDVVWWSPDGTTLLYAAWSEEGPGRAGIAGGGLIAVPADRPNDATVLIAGSRPVPDAYSHPWAPIQMWGRE